MNEDLKEIEKELNKRGLGEEAETSSTSISNSEVPTTNQTGAVATKDLFEVKTEEPKKVDQVKETVQEIFSAAVAHQVANDTELKEDMLKTAKEVINNQVETIKNDADTDSKRSYFNNNKDACELFLYEETTTAKSHVKIMKTWAYILNTIFIFTFGLFIISPIMFICKKVKILIKHVWLAAVVAVLIYLMIILIPLLIGLLS